MTDYAKHIEVITEMLRPRMSEDTTADDMDAALTAAIELMRTHAALETKLTNLRTAAECLVEEIEHVVGTAAVADVMFAIEASR